MCVVIVKERVHLLGGSGGCPQVVSILVARDDVLPGGGRSAWCTGDDRWYQRSPHDISGAKVLRARLYWCPRFLLGTDCWRRLIRSVEGRNRRDEIFHANLFRETFLFPSQGIDGEIGIRKTFVACQRTSTTRIRASIGGSKVTMPKVHPFFHLTGRLFGKVCLNARLFNQSLHALQRRF